MNFFSGSTSSKVKGRKSISENTLNSNGHLTWIGQEYSSYKYHCHIIFPDLNGGVLLCCIFKNTKKLFPRFVLGNKLVLHNLPLLPYFMKLPIWFTIKIPLLVRLTCVKVNFVIRRRFRSCSHTIPKKVRNSRPINMGFKGWG